MLRALIVDDEELCIVELQYMLDKITGIEVCGTASSGKNSIELCEKLSPDVIFLDIQMNDMSGFEVAEKIFNKTNPPKIIFVTAYDEYALKAFEINALDYILKPFSELRLQKTAERIFEIFENREKTAQTIKNDINSITALKGLNKIAVEKKSRLILIDYSDIIFIEAKGKKTLIITEKETYKASHSLKELEENLKPYYFFKPHRSYLINLRKINEIIPWFNSTYKIIMQGYPDIEIQVTRNNVKSFKKILGM